MKQIIEQVVHRRNQASATMLDTVDGMGSEIKRTVESHLAPIRQSFVKRYPVLFSLMVLFGLTTTYYGFEKILGQYEILNQHPWLILLLGISILAWTGTLYKRM